MERLTDIAAPPASGMTTRSTGRAATRRAGAATATWEALGTSVVLRVADPEALPEAEAAVREQLGAVDLACSRFRADSELSRINAQQGAARRARVSPLLCEALALALRAAELTDGAVDPTIGAALTLAGYDRDWRELTPATATGLSRPDGALAPALVAKREGWRSVRLDMRLRELHLPAGIQLDLGATAKAWAADRCARAATGATSAAAIVALGGDIAVAGEAPAEGWPVLVKDDHRSASGGQRIVIRDGGLATSSTTVRRWIHQGREMHHILDPATGAPVDGAWRTVSVAAGNCADANIAATAAILRSHDAPEWLERLRLPARLVSHDGAVQTVGGWPLDRRANAEAGPDRERQRAASEPPAIQRREAA